MIKIFAAVLFVAASASAAQAYRIPPRDAWEYYRVPSYDQRMYRSWYRDVYRPSHHYDYPRGRSYGPRCYW